MAATIIVSAQWGDKDKDKAADILGGHVDCVIELNGGNSVNHTVVTGGGKYELKPPPAGVLSENATPIIGNGCVVNFEAPFDGTDSLEARGAKASRLRVSDNAHMVAPYHQALGRVTERFLGRHAIGTIGRGIGPTYADKVGRTGLRVQDTLDESILRQRIESSLAQENQILVKLHNRRATNPDKAFDYFMGFADRLRPMIINSELGLSRALDAGKHVLMGGGQTTMSGVDHGIYPFVTSSNPTVGSACMGADIGPAKITSVLGIMKIYATRVDVGPLSTELFDKWGEYLQTTGGEVGVDTDRKRRCGWYDSVLARYTARINSFTDLFITKLDVLTDISEVPIYAAYDVDGMRHGKIPLTQSEFHHAVPIYETMPAWDGDITGCRTSDELPDEAKDYLNHLGELSSARIPYIGVSPGHDQTIVIHDVLDNQYWSASAERLVWNSGELVGKQSGFRPSFVELLDEISSVSKPLIAVKKNVC